MKNLCRHKSHCTEHNYVRIMGSIGRNYPINASCEIPT